MRWTLILSVLIFLTIYEKEDVKVNILKATVNGDTINFTGNAYRYRDLRNEKPFGYSYHIFNLTTPNIYIEAYDSSFTKTHFDFSSLKAKYACNDSNGIVKSYDAISGEFMIIKEKNEVLFGNFTFSFLNIHDVSDTLIVDDGYFEITLQKNDRVWYD